MAAVVAVAARTAAEDFVVAAVAVAVAHFVAVEAMSPSAKGGIAAASEFVAAAEARTAATGIADTMAIVAIPVVDTGAMDTDTAAAMAVIMAGASTATAFMEAAFMAIRWAIRSAVTITTITMVTIIHTTPAAMQSGIPV